MPQSFGKKQIGKAWIKKRLEIPQVQPEVINGRTDNVIKCKETKE